MITIALAALGLVLSAVPLVAPQQSPPRDPVRATAARPLPGDREIDLASRIAAGREPVDVYLELSNLQETRGAYSDAETTLLKARNTAPGDSRVARALAGFYNRQGQFDKTMEALETAARLEPNNPASYQIIAVFYWEKASKDLRLTDVQKWTYIHDGIAATDRALALDPDYSDALTYKNILLRMRGNLETDPAERQRAYAEADLLRNRAIEINKQKASSGYTGTPGAPPPPPPPPPPPGALQPGGEPAPVRVGGTIKVPTRIRPVPPVYPPE